MRQTMRFPLLCWDWRIVWGNWNTSMPGEMEKGLQAAAITQCKYYPASTEKNSGEESRLGGSQSSLNHQFVDCSQTQLRLEKKSAVRKESEIAFVSPEACGWLELQAAGLVIVWSCFVCKSENCNNISYSPRRARSKDSLNSPFTVTSSSESLYSLSLPFNQWRLLMETTPCFVGS